MTKILSLVVALAVVALFIAACGQNARAPAADESTAAAAPAAEPANVAEVPVLDAATIRSLSDELTRLRAQIAAMRTAQTAPPAPKPQLVAKLDEPVAPVAPVVEDDGAAPVAPPDAGDETNMPGAAPRTVVVERQTVVERETPVYVDREVPVVVEQEVPVYVDREVVVEQPTTVVVVQSDTCAEQFHHDAAFGGAWGPIRGRHDDGHDHDRRGREASPPSSDVPPPVVRHEPTPKTPHPRAPEHVERAPLPILPSSPNAVAESTRTPFDPPAPVVVRDPPAQRKPARQPDEQDRPRSRVEPAPLPIQPPATKSAPDPRPTSVVAKPAPVAAPAPAPVPAPPPPPPPRKQK
jgi:ribonuclease E